MISIGDRTKMVMSFSQRSPFERSQPCTMIHTVTSLVAFTMLSNCARCCVSLTSPGISMGISSGAYCCGMPGMLPATCENGMCVTCAPSACRARACAVVHVRWRHRLKDEFAPFENVLSFDEGIARRWLITRTLCNNVAFRVVSQEDFARTRIFFQRFPHGFAGLDDHLGERFAWNGSERPEPDSQWREKCPRQCGPCHVLEFASLRHGTGVM